MTEGEAKKRRKVIKWLNDQIDTNISDMEEAGMLAEEYQKALDRYEAKGTLPRSIWLEVRKEAL